MILKMYGVFPSSTLGVVMLVRNLVVSLFLGFMWAFAVGGQRCDSVDFEETVKPLDGVDMGFVSDI
jgi:hypothetical protein